MTAPVQIGDLVDAELDSRTIEHLDFEVVCRLRFALFLLTVVGPVLVSKGPACAEPAVALMHCRTCHTELLICAKHRAEVASDPQSFCYHCCTRGHGSVVFEFRDLPKAGA